MTERSSRTRFSRILEAVKISQISAGRGWRSKTKPGGLQGSLGLFSSSPTVNFSDDVSFLCCVEESGADNLGTEPCPSATIAEAYFVLVSTPFQMFSF